MNRIFYTNINSGIRRPTMKASGFAGRPGKYRAENEARSKRACFFAVVFYASQTITPDARFGSMDLLNGAVQGAWVPGTIFRNVRTGQLWYFDGHEKKIRKVKDVKVQKCKGADAL